MDPPLTFWNYLCPGNSSNSWTKGCQVGHRRVTLAFPIARKNVLLSGRTRATQESKSILIFCLSILSNCSTASSYYCAILCHLNFQLNKGFLWMQVTHFWKVISSIFTYFNPELQRKLYTNDSCIIIHIYLKNYFHTQGKWDKIIFC